MPDSFSFNLLDDHLNLSFLIKHSFVIELSCYFFLVHRLIEVGTGRDCDGDEKSPRQVD